MKIMKYENVMKCNDNEKWNNEMKMKVMKSNNNKM